MVKYVWQHALCLFSSIQKKGQKREIFICQWHGNREGRGCLAILPAASIQTSTILLRTHAPAVPIRSPPASPGTEAHASLAALVSGCRRAGNPCPPGLWDPPATPLKRHSFGRPQNFFFLPVGWGGVVAKVNHFAPLTCVLQQGARRCGQRQTSPFLFFFIFLSLLFQPRLSRPFISAALSSPFLLGKRRCISTSRPPPSHDIAVQPVLNSGHHVVINTPDRDDARRAPERGLQVAHLLGHLEKVWHILCAPLFDARPPRSVLLRWHKRCYYIECRHAKSAVKPSGGFGVSTQSAASTNERVDVLCKLALIGCEHLDSASENMC